MKELRNTFDIDIAFSNLEDAKSYYKDRLAWEDYHYCVESASTLEELAEALNEYSDELDGSRYFVKEF